MTRSATLNPAPFAQLRWGPASMRDAPALVGLQQAARGGTLTSSECTPFLTLLTPGKSFTLIALRGVDEAGDLRAFASAAIYTTDDEHRADLDAYVHPDVPMGKETERGLLQWAESQAREALARTSGDRPAVARIAFTDRRPHAYSLYEELGFGLTLAADTMHRDLTVPIPDPHIPDDMHLLPWSESRARLVHAIHVDAFAAHAQFQVWRACLTDCSAFRPHLSLLLMDGATPTAYTICWIHPSEVYGGDGTVGTIVQLGVRPRFRRRGLGWNLMLTALHGLRQAGLKDAYLEVRADNTSALQLHHKLGFTTIARLTVFTKPLTLPSSPLPLRERGRG